MKDILQELEDKRKKKNEEEISEDERKVATFYSAAMNEEEIEKVGIKPMKPVLDLCVEIASKQQESGDPKEYAKLLGTLAYKYGICPFFAIGVSPDNENTNMSITQIYQGGLGLPDRDYYFDDDKEEKRIEYKKCIAIFLTLLSNPKAATATEEGGVIEPTDEMIEMASKVYELELKLAEKHMTKTENRDPHATYNKMSMEQFMERCGGGTFDFEAYLTSATGKTKEELGDINVRNVDALQRVAEIASTIDDDNNDATLLAYLNWMSIKSCAPYLSQVFVNEHFKFYEKCLMGTAEIKPRWKRAMAFTESALGECLGKLYCSKYFDETSKDRALDIVERVRQALEDRLKEVDWMKADTTRTQALQKMNSFGVKIGYPDKWIDYTPLKIDEEKDDFLSMVFKSRQFDNDRDNNEMNAPTDKSKWVRFACSLACYFVVYLMFNEKKPSSTT